MLTMHDETTLDRYKREREVELAHYAKITPEEIEQLVIAKNNAETQLHSLREHRDELLSVLQNVQDGTEFTTEFCQRIDAAIENALA